jgi:type II secretory pathway pseudopilin PulG
MKFATRTPFARSPRDKRREDAFTLAEVLAALVFMAIVIPVAVHGLQVASRAGEVAQRKAIAARVGERVLNQIVTTRQFSQSQQRGTVQEGPFEFQWAVRNQPWERDSMKQLSVQVTFTAQGQDYSVWLSTLVGNSQL